MIIPVSLADYTLQQSVATSSGYAGDSRGFPLIALKPIESSKNFDL
jgi:hypothetical protein